MNIIIWGVRIIEDSDNRGSDNRGCTVAAFTGVTNFSRLVTMGDHSPEPVDETMSGNKFHCKNK